MRLEGPVLRPSGEVTLSADAVRLRGHDAGAMVVRAHTTGQGDVAVLNLGESRASAPKADGVAGARSAAALDCDGWRWEAPTSFTP